MDERMKIRLDVIARKKDKERKDTDKIVTDFARAMFKRSPKLLGLTICGVQIPGKFRDKENNRLSGIFIKNKDALISGDKDE